MTHAKAKVIFATHMQAARSRKLTQYELNQLSQARQILRQQKKPAMNPLDSSADKYWFNKGFDDACLGIKPRNKKKTYLIGYREGKHYCDTREKYGHPTERKGKSNPSGVLIYGEVQTIYAKKTQNHVCDDDCKAHGHRYYHKFSSKPKMYGLPDGTLLIKP